MDKYIAKCQKNKTEYYFLHAIAIKLKRGVDGVQVEIVEEF